ncbi:MAG: DEAD/DEAH box helicase family protein [Anaerolineae bacterium]|nr:DEAD/DEAH box helicase family protein [Anaerolineae bacterium]
MPTPEVLARKNIDRLLAAAGWVVQDFKQLNLGAGIGVAVREFQTQSGPADYVLFVDRKAVGIVEAKKAGTTLSGVFEQSARYMTSFPEDIPHVELPLPFSYESTGVETRFVDLRDPNYRSRRVFHFHRPETLREWLIPSVGASLRLAPTLRGRLRDMPEKHPLITKGLWDAQIEAITSLEQSFAQNKPRALIQMATGSGKTFTAVSFIYRLIKFAGAKRVLFLVDRNNLGKQTLREFQGYITPDDGRKFTELYNVQRLTSNVIDPVCKVTVTTIQRLFSMLKGDAEYEETNEEMSWFEQNIPLTPSSQSSDSPLPVGEGPGVREVAYNPDIPIETFDFIITDECHRSIYNLWRQALEYFDAFLIGLTATPSKHTLGFFEQNLVTEYTHERAVADGVNVGYEVYRIRTQITQAGGQVEAGHYVDKRDKKTRAVRWEQLEDDLAYAPNQLDRDVVAKDQIRTVIQTFRDRLFSEIFPGRTEVPKTLIFAKDDSHAEDIVEIVREVFGKGNEFCKKITYRSGEKPEDLIASFRNAYDPRIAVTVDMISTGTDIKPLECLLFLRMIRSQGYFEQMKGRGTRVISDTDLTAVTPDAGHKTHFVLVDAVGVCEQDMTDTRPLERKKHIPFDKLLQRVAMGVRDADSLESLAGRLARLDRALTPKDRASVELISGGLPLKKMIHNLLDSVDPDIHLDYALKHFDLDPQVKAGLRPAPMEVIQKAQESLIQKACAPFDNAQLREILVGIQQRSEQVLDTVSQDELVEARFVADEARRKVATFEEFIAAHKDELTALQILYSQPYGARRLTYQAVRELAEAIERPPYNLTPESLWRAYERLDQARVRGAGPSRLLTDIIALVRFALEQSETLEPFPLTVAERYRAWLVDQLNAGRQFSPEQLEWLEMIRTHIAASVTIEMDDFEEVPFNQKGGAVKVYQLFGDELDGILDELTQVLVG